jgi:hypothetical protein
MYFEQTYPKADHIADRIRQWALGNCPPVTPVRDMTRHCPLGITKALRTVEAFSAILACIPLRIGTPIGLILKFLRIGEPIGSDQSISHL